MELKIAVLPGDGIGPEISAVGVDVMTAVCQKFGHKVTYQYALCGADAIDKVGDPFPEDTYHICKEADAVLFSAVGDPKYDNDPTAKVRPEQGLLAMRKKLGLYANIRPVQTFKCLLHKSPLRAELVEGADFLCIRELTGGMYFGEKYQDNDKAWDTNYYTRPEIERILRVAFEYAMRRRKHVTVVDKANVLASSRLWRQIAQEMAPRYPEVTTDYMFVDNAAMKMIRSSAARWVSCLRLPPGTARPSSNPSTAAGRKPRDRTSPTPWRKSCPSRCFSSTSALRRRALWCAKP